MYRKLSKIVRENATRNNGCSLVGTPYPIKMIDGFAPPKLTGRSYYWTTPSGKTEVRYPNAYKWPTVYHASTYCIVVGKGWLIERGVA